jgi:hypothetical protein
MAQLIWFIARPDEFRTFRSVVNRSVWTPLIQNRALYRHYYLGIAIKRLRDNLVPILASNFFTSREALGAFFLAYRGLQFTLGQVRIIENLLNHRHTLARFIKMTCLCGRSITGSDSANYLFEFYYLDLCLFND